MRAKKLDFRDADDSRQIHNLRNLANDQATGTFVACGGVEVGEVSDSQLKVSKHADSQLQKRW
jgi:hypothetical protein